MYGYYLLASTNNIQLAQQYFSKANQKMYSFEDSFFSIYFNKIEVNLKGILVISGNSDTLGVILQSNSDLSKIYELAQEDLLGLQVNKVMPKMIAEIHDQILLNLFTNYSASKSITRVIHNFSINADKFLVIIFSLVKTLPWLYQKGINFIALVIPDENLNQRAVILIDPRNNQLLGINQICY